MKGWVPLLGIPALFMLALVLGHFPSVVEIPICCVRHFIGIECPGCGLTHSMVALASGDIQKSVSYHPLGIVIALWFAYHFFRAAAMVSLRRPLPPLLSPKYRMFLMNAFIFAMMVQWIVKLVIS